ncbi:MAG: radical SAM protein [Desulfobacteraceae bacterium]|nr:MAG: radical SAM protein [Desulfobacteraceae bacterium]
MKRILLIPSINIANGKIVPYLPLGLLSLQSATLNYKMVDIFIFHDDLLNKRCIDSDDLIENIIHKIDFKTYDTIGLSAVCNSFHHTLYLSKRIKEIDDEIGIWLGGPHVFPIAEDILKNFEQIDAVFIGEAEQSFLEAVNRRATGLYDLTNIPGVLIRNSRPSKRDLIADLDDLPYLHENDAFYNIFNSLYKNNFTKSIPIDASRGCFGRCKYCSTRLFWDNIIRRKSNARLLSEMNHYHEKTNLSLFEFVGDNFSSPRRLFIDFCRHMINTNHSFKWGCSIRISDIKIDDLKILHEAGCKGVFIGLESASQITLNKLNKNINLKQGLKIIEEALKMDFEIVTSFIVGFPWESDEDINNTFKLHCSLLEMGVKTSQIHALGPLPGTELLKHHSVHYDRDVSDVSLDDIHLNDYSKFIIKRYPELFVHLGHYDSPNLDRSNVASIVATSFQLNYIYEIARL